MVLTIESKSNSVPKKKFRSDLKEDYTKSVIVDRPSFQIQEKV